MGYKIRVNHQQLKSTANAIEQYNSKLDKNMKKADSTMATLFGTWKGIDASSYKTKWDAIDAGGSTHQKMKKSLASYAKYLKSAANKYSQAQAKAIQRGICLPRW